MQSNMIRLLAILSCSSQVLSTPLSPPNNAPQIQSASTKNGGLNTEGIETLDGIPLGAIPEGRSAPARNAVAMSAATTQTWTATADSYQPNNPPSNAIDGNANTFWHTEYSPVTPQLPHYLQIDMKQSYLINSISYQPRQDGVSNGNIGGHQITLSADGITFGAPKVLGTWRDDSSTKTSVFEASNARYVRLTALTEAGGRGPWSSVAELKIFTTTTPAPSYAHINGGEWSPTIDFPLVPVSAALEYNSGNILVWSSFAASTFIGASGGQTLTSTFYPSSQTVSQRLVINTAHDMFCVGLNLDANGRIMAMGGNTAQKTSLYTPSSDSWSALPNMITQRGYQAAVTLSDGRTFTIGGSWSGGQGNKNGEVYNPKTNSWQSLPGCPVAPMLTNDAQGVYRADNHGWLFAWKQGSVFQAGPSKALNWYYTTGSGGQKGAGTRAADGDSMCGNAVMFDAVAGKILTVGGAANYQGVDATANAHIITLGAPGTTPTVQTINNMYFQRIFANAVVLPNGYTFIVGGQVYGAPFSDDTSQLQPEIYNYVTGHFQKTAPMAVPRNYHSTAILLADATIFVGGGGLCGSCSTNHYDAQVYSPYYLFNTDSTRASRPVINSATGQVVPGGKITATTNRAVSTWSLIRMSSTTHAVNTDQRRIPLTATASGNTYTMTVPSDPGIAIPGYWMLFAMDVNNVPSVARYVYIPAA